MASQCPHLAYAAKQAEVAKNPQMKLDLQQLKSEIQETTYISVHAAGRPGAQRGGGVRREARGLPTLHAARLSRPIDRAAYHP